MAEKGVEEQVLAMERLHYIFLCELCKKVCSELCRGFGGFV